MQTRQTLGLPRHEETGKAGAEEHNRKHHEPGESGDGFASEQSGRDEAESAGPGNDERENEIGEGWMRLHETAAQ